MMSQVEKGRETFEALVEKTTLESSLECVNQKKGVCYVTKLSFFKTSIIDLLQRKFLKIEEGLKICLHYF